MLRPTPDCVYKTLLLVPVYVACLCVGTVAAAQPADPQVLDMNAIESVPATVGVSLDEPAVIEFSGMTIESVEASESGQILAEVSGSTISILANREDVNTEFAVSLVGGPTVLFTFVSDTGAASPKRYVVDGEQATVSATGESAEVEAAADVAAEMRADADAAAEAAEEAAAEAEAAEEAAAEAEMAADVAAEAEGEAAAEAAEEAAAEAEAEAEAAVEAAAEAEAEAAAAAEAATEAEAAAEAVVAEATAAAEAEAADVRAAAAAAEAEAQAAEAAREAAQAEETAAAEAEAQAEEAAAEAEARAAEAAQEAAAEAEAQAEEAAAVQAAAAAAQASVEDAEAGAAAAESSQADSSGDLLPSLKVQALPPQLEFKTSAYQPSLESMVVQYSLTNNAQNLLANDPQRLRIYADGEAVPFEQVLPKPGRSKRLPVGGVEYGELFIPSVPANASDLILEWELVEIGPGTTYQAGSDLVMALSETPLSTPETATAEQDAATAQTVEPTAEPEAPAATASSDEQPPTQSDAQPPAQAAEVSAANEAEQLLPPEILAEIRRRGADITVIGGSFDEPEMDITNEGNEVTGVSALDTWSLYTRERAEASATVEGGEACIDVGGESELFQVQDIGFGYAGYFPLTRGRTYRLTFEAYADKPVFFRSLVGLATSPYSESFARVEALGTQQQTFFYTFEARNDSDLNRVAFLLGGNQASSFRICFDNIVLTEAGDVAEDPVSSSSQ